MDHTTEIGIWAQLTGLNVTDVRHHPPVYVDGIAVQNSSRIELQIDGKWEDPEQPVGVYTFSGPVELTITKSRE